MVFVRQKTTTPKKENNMTYSFDELDFDTHVMKAGKENVAPTPTISKGGRITFSKVAYETYKLKKYKSAKIIKDVEGNLALQFQKEKKDGLTISPVKAGKKGEMKETGAYFINAGVRLKMLDMVKEATTTEIAHHAESAIAVFEVIPKAEESAE
jgi:hypothetical protein